MTGSLQNLKPIQDRLNRGVCPIVRDPVGNGFRVDGIATDHVKLFALVCKIDLQFPLPEFFNRLADGRLTLQND